MFRELNLMEDFDYETDIKSIPNKYKVFFNGNWIGFTNDPFVMITQARSYRRADLIDSETSFVLNIDDKEIKYFFSLPQLFFVLITYLTWMNAFFNITVYIIIKQNLYRFRQMYETTIYSKFC